jgi:uncharacterized membrane protein YkoI
VSNGDLLQTLPIPVRQTVQAQLGSGTLDDVSRTNGDAGEVLYDVDFTRDGKSRNITVALQGKLLDMLVYLDETPLPVRTSIQTNSQGGQLGDITKNFGDHDDITYDVELTRDGATRDFSVDDRGMLLELLVLLPETPPAVQKTIKAKVAGNILGDITKSLDDDEVTYDVEMTAAGTHRSFTVSADGKLLQEQVLAEELPEAVQKAVQAQARRGHLSEINQSTDAGKVYYEVALRIGLNTCRVTLDADGALDSEQEDLAWSALPANLKIALPFHQATDEKIEGAVRATAGTNTTYEIKLRNATARRTLTFDHDGKIVPH